MNYRKLHLNGAGQRYPTETFGRYAVATRHPKRLNATHPLPATECLGGGIAISGAIERDPEAVLKRFDAEARLEGLEPTLIEAWLAKQRRDH